MNKKLLLIILAVVVLLGGGGGLAAVLLMGGSEEPEPKADTRPPGLVELDSFVVNLTDDRGERFAKLDLKLTVKPASLADEIAADTLLTAKIRDRTLTLLASKTYEDLITPLGKENLRREVKARLDPLFANGEIDEVLFSEFVVQ